MESISFNDNDFHFDTIIRSRLLVVKFACFITEQ